MLVGLATCALVLQAGCASRSAHVIARQNAQYQLSATNKFTIAEHAHPRPEEQALRTALMTELHQQGFKLVPPSEAEYTLSYWIDVSWKRGKIVVSDREGTWADPLHDSGPRFVPTVVPVPGGQPMATHTWPSISKQRVVEVPWETQGIRLKIFPQESMRAGNLTTAWDGYIEGGDQVSEAREPVLVRTLLNYLGKDFVGRAKLVTSTTPD